MTFIEGERVDRIGIHEMDMKRRTFESGKPTSRKRNTKMPKAKSAHPALLKLGDSLLPLVDAEVMLSRETEKGNGNEVGVRVGDDTFVCCCSPFWRDVTLVILEGSLGVSRS